MPMPAPLLLLAAPLIPATLTWLTRRWARLSAAAGALSALVLCRLTATVHLVDAQTGLFAGAELPILGRSLILRPDVQATFTLLYGSLGLLMVLAIWWRQGRVFVPTSFLVLALLAGAMMARPFSFGVLFLLAAAAGTTVIIQSERAGATDAAFRYLTFVTLATPLFLVSGWMLDSAQASLQTIVWGLLLAGSTLLLAGFPFIIWVRPLVVTGSSLTPAFVFGLVGLGHLTFLLTLFGENQWVYGVTTFTDLLRVSGLLTVILGSLLALISRLAGNLLGALLLIELGCTQMWVAVGDAGMVSAAAIPRFLALMTAGVGASLMTNAALQESAWPRRLGLAAFLYGGLSLTGLPLTPAFWTRWELVSTLASQGKAGTWAIVLLFGSIALALAGLVQFARTAATNPSQGTSTMPETGVEFSQQPMLGLVALVLALSVWLALAPQSFWQLALPLVGP